MKVGEAAYAQPGGAAGAAGAGEPPRPDEPGAKPPRDDVIATLACLKPRQPAGRPFVESRVDTCLPPESHIIQAGLTSMRVSMSIHSKGRKPSSSITRAAYCVAALRLLGCHGLAWYDMPRPAQPPAALPFPCPCPVPDLPSLSLPRLALPCPSSPRLAPPSPALPFLSLLGSASPRQALHCPARPPARLPACPPRQPSDLGRMWRPTTRRTTQGSEALPRTRGFPSAVQPPRWGRASLDSEASCLEFEAGTPSFRHRSFRPVACFRLWAARWPGTLFLCQGQEAVATGLFVARAQNRRESLRQRPAVLRRVHGVSPGPGTPERPCAVDLAGRSALAGQDFWPRDRLPG